DEIADGRDVSWIWDVDFEPLLPGLDRLIASGGPAPQLAPPLPSGGPRARATARRARPPLPLRRPRRGRDRARAGPRGRARPWARADAARRRARPPPYLHGHARPATAARRARPHPSVLGALGMTAIRVGHLYPDYLNIYADRGNIA